MCLSMCLSMCLCSCRSRNLTALVGLCVLAQYSNAQPATFRIIPDTGQLSMTSVVGVSSDGQTVGGNSNTGGDRAVRWEPSSGISLLNITTGGTADFVASGMSRNGMFMVGTGAGGTGAAVWDGQVGSYRILPELPGGATGGTATAISEDGSVIIGQAYGPAGLTAFRYTATGLVPLATHTSDGNIFRVWSVARAMTPAGFHVVGFRRLSSNGSTNAFRWTQESGMVSIGDLPGGSVASDAMACSDGANVIVGVSSGIDGNEAFVWRSSTGMRGLGDFPQGIFGSQANGVSADGETIVGFGTVGASPLDQAAFIYTAAAGMRSLRDVLIEQGATIPDGVILSSAVSISPDGRVIVGISRGSNRNSVWIATQGVAGRCVSDWNNDGGIDGADIEAFFVDFAAGTADANDDGGTDGSDVEAFFTRWQTGEC
jgi:hypothetical protein